MLKLKYDPIADFARVSMMAQTPNVLVVGEKNKAKILQKFLAQARARTGGVSFSSAGLGLATHLIVEYLENQAKLDLVHVPYKSATPAIQDFLGRQVDAMLTSLTTALRHIKLGFSIRQSSGFQLRAQFRKRLDSSDPQDIQIDIKVGMNESVAHARDRRPRQ